MSTTPQPSSRSIPVPALLIGAGVLVIIGYIAWTMLGSNGSTAAEPAFTTPPPVVETEEPTPTAEPTESEMESEPIESSAPPVVVEETTAVEVAPAEDTLDPEAAALDQLAAYANQFDSIIPKNGQWVAQLSSKYLGVSDPLLTAANGTHTFYATDILAEFEQIAQDVTSVQVVLMDSRDYGKQQLIDGKNLWVTFGLSDYFTSEDDVLAWCEEEFWYLEGRERLNVCMPGRLKPPNG